MITLQDARYHLRLDGSDSDTELTAKLAQAEAIVGTYLGVPAGNGPDTYDAARDAAVLLVLGELWANREASAAAPLSAGVRNLLDILRPPTWA